MSLISILLQKAADPFQKSFTFEYFFVTLLNVFLNIQIEFGLERDPS
jgi:hypothetical protein